MDIYILYFIFGGKDFLRYHKHLMSEQHKWFTMKNLNWLSDSTDIGIDNIYIYIYNCTTFPLNLYLTNKKLWLSAKDNQSAFDIVMEFHSNKDQERTIQETFL